MYLDPTGVVPDQQVVADPQDHRLRQHRQRPQGAGHGWKILVHLEVHILLILVRRDRVQVHLLVAHSHLVHRPAEIAEVGYHPFPLFHLVLD